MKLMLHNARLNWQTHDSQFKSKWIVSLITYDDDDDDDDMGMMNGDKKQKGNIFVNQIDWMWDWIEW